MKRQLRDAYRVIARLLQSPAYSGALRHSLLVTLSAIEHELVAEPAVPPARREAGDFDDQPTQPGPW
jgi:hypothetical protein